MCQNFLKIVFVGWTKLDFVKSTLVTCTFVYVAISMPTKHGDLTNLDLKDFQDHQKHRNFFLVGSQC